MGFDRKNRSGCNFTPSVIIHGQILVNFQIYYAHEIKIDNTKIMNICRKAKKIRVLNLNLASEISCDASQRKICENSRMRPLS